MDRSTAREMVTSLIGDEGIAAARAPIEQASGLPNAAYTDAAWLDLDDPTTVGIDEEFAALGGHSLLAAELCGRLNDAHSWALRVREVFSHPTVRQLADLVSERGWTPA